MKFSYLLLLFLSCTAICSAQQKYTEEQLRQDADVLYSTILDVHPYMFTNISKKQFEQKLEGLKSGLKDSMTVFDFYKMFSPLIAQIEDGHTELFFPVESAIHLGMKVFPYEVKVNKTDTTVIIQKGFSGAELSRGTRILSINGVPVKELLGRTYSMLSGEAYHYKMERLNILFSPLLYFVLSSDQFTIEYIQDGKMKTKNIQGKLLSEYLETFISSINETAPYSFNMNKEVDTAILKLNSFDFYKENEKNEYRNFLDSVFKEIEENQINNLIIDIRQNGGGLESLVWDLFQYISSVPFQTAGQSINKVSETVKETYDLEEETGIYVFGNDLISLRENSLRFSGNCYLLTSNFTFSSAKALAWGFQYFNMGTIVGEETGGMIIGYGNVFNTHLPNTKLPYGVSRWKYYCYGAKEDQKHGVIPDIIVPAEEAMEKTMEIIGNK